jgi:hypothetical protein
LAWQVRRARLGCTPTEEPTAVLKADKADIAKAKPTKAGQFISQRATASNKRQKREAEEVLQEKLDNHIAEHKEEVKKLKAASSTALHFLNAQLAQKTTLIRSIRAKAANTHANLGEAHSAQPAP